MDYNTTRKKLILPEYGRNIQKMVEYACSIQDREERNRVARAIIAVMGNLNPTLRDQGDVRHKLWDHMAIISDFQLDIDSPYDPPSQEEFYSKPRPVPYKQNEVKYMHYGRITEALIKKAVEMPDGEEKERLISLIANQMKKSFVTWNKNQVSDEIIFKDLQAISGGKIKVSQDLKLAEAKEFIPKQKRKKNITRKQDQRPMMKQRPHHE
jgi:hypothetical protein